MTRRTHPDTDSPLPWSTRLLRRPWFLPEGRRLSEAVWAQRHRGLTVVLWAHLPLLFAFGMYRGVGLSDDAVQVGVLLVPALAASLPWLSRNVRSASASLGLVMGASVLVHLSGGSITAHFQFFVVLGFLTLYQAWLPFLLALLYVVGEHGILGALDPSQVYDNSSGQAHPWQTALVHGGFVLAASAANVLSWRLTEQESLRDGLTGLPNRVALLDALDKTLQSKRRGTAVLFVDLDNFKDANDAFGHHVGDELLVALAHRLTRQLRPSDVLARLGGDEFAIVLSDLLSKDEAKAIGDRLLNCIQEEVRIGDISLAAYASVGLAFAQADMTAADLLRNADLAMYEAKRDGGSRLCEFQPSLHTAALRRTELEVELRAALEGEQFVLHYQPIVDLASQRIVGTEALVRWQHPTRGLLAPGEFITAAEQSGLIVSLGAWVIRTACQQTAAWQQAQPDGAPLTVAVNLSPRQLVDRALVATVAEALHDSGLDASSLCLEITEGSVIKDFEQTMPVLNALRTLGVSLALDDFGTGYSSLSYLKQLPVNTVKIDRSFVSDLGSDNPNSQIVLAIIELAHALGMSVTAEGAETGTQLDVLKAMNSDHAQGYLLGRPMPSEALGAVVGPGAHGVAP
ncbi:MAG: diguanylate cyclase/phosphodiesterase, partial [Frankiales bacterium]|nr:diguanylate cyclase/phosphodiesterase [Frankiales bacterium]